MPVWKRTTSNTNTIADRCGLLRNKHRCWHSWRRKRGRRHGALLRTHDVQRHREKAGMAYHQQNGECGRWPQCLYKQRRDCGVLSFHERAFRKSSRTHLWHCVSQHIPPAWDRQGMWGYYWWDRKLQRQSCRTNIRPFREYHFCWQQSRTRHPWQCRQCAALYNRWRASFPQPSLPSR